jgi:hypothetical protein
VTRFRLLQIGILFVLILSGASIITLGSASLFTPQRIGRAGTHVAILNEVYNPDGTTTVTVRIVAAPDNSTAQDSTYWPSQDTFIASGNPNGNYGSSPNMGIGYSSSGGYGEMRMLLHFNLSSIPVNATINSATIYVYQYAALGYSNMDFQAQYAVTPWNEYNATWNNANYIGGAALPVGDFPNTLGWLSFNGVKLIQSWVNGSEPNYGLIITGNEDPLANSSRWFYSSNAGSNPPYIDIIYTANPTVSINPLPTWTTATTFTVSWIGNAQGGPSITSYNFEVNLNNSGWTRLLSNTPLMFYQYSGSDGNNYQFRGQASNNGGASFGPWSAVVSTSVDSTPPSTTMNPLPQYTPSTSFWVSWNGTDSGSGIATYNLQSQFNNGAWQTLISNTPQTSFYFQNAQTGNYGFRVQAVDNAGNLQTWPASAQANTLVLVNPIAVIQPFNPPIIQSTSLVTKSFVVNWTGYTPPGTYLAGYTVTYRYDDGPWLLWSTFSATQTSATFNWFDMGLPDEAIYQFQATASNNLGQLPYELPSQYWQTMIVDMQDDYRPPYSISGKVTDTGGNAIPEVTVSTGNESAITNASGYYTITGLVTGTYTLTPTKSGYAFSPCSLSRINVPPHLTGQDFTATPIDFWIDSVLPVQVLEGQGLVRGKATAVKAVIRKTGCGMVSNVSAQASIGTFTTTRFYVADQANLNAQSQYRLVADNTEYMLNFSTTEVTKTIYFFSDSFAPTGSTFQVSVTVGNNRMSTAVPVYDTRWGIASDLTVFYFMVDWWDRTAFDDYYDYSNHFLNAVLPVAESRYKPSKSTVAPVITLPFRGLDGKFSKTEFYVWLADMAVSLRLSYPFIDKFVATMPSGWFVEYTHDYKTSLGAGHPLLPSLVVAEARTTNKPNGLSTAAHELGHTFGLWATGDCEEYYPACNPDIKDNFGNYAATGLFVDERIPLKITNNRKVYCFMGAYDQQDIGRPEYWIDTTDYSKILDVSDLVTLQSDYQTGDTAETRVILASGIFDVDGTVTLSDWYLLNEAELSKLGSGPYAFEYRDAGGNLVHSVNFDVAFASAGVLLDQAPFVITIPYMEGVAEIAITRKGVPLAVKQISAHTPIVTVLTPNGGEMLDGIVPIQWSGDDADQDPLSYAALVSPDNGITWETLAIDVEGSNYIWDTSQYPPGSQYRIKIIATDGFNTGEDISDFSFTIPRSIYLPFVRRGQ